MSALLISRPDGAKPQAAAVLAMVRERLNDGIEASWDSRFSRYMAEPHVSRWENGREQGYVVWMKNRHYDKQINIIFYEHRSSDDICAIVYVGGTTTNAPNLATLPDNVINSDRGYNVSVKFGEITKMAKAIVRLLVAFWIENDRYLDADQRAEQLVLVDRALTEFMLFVAGRPEGDIMKKNLDEFEDVFKGWVPKDRPEHETVADVLAHPFDD